MTAPGLTADQVADMQADLRRVPETLRQLDTTITRTDAVAPERVGSSGHTVRVVPFNQAASDARVELERVLRVHAGNIAGYLGVTVLGTGPRRHAQFLEHTLPVVAGLSGTAVIAQDISGAMSRAWKAVDRQPGRVYLGNCPKCSEGLNANRGARRVTCGCGAEYDADELRARNVARARTRAMTATELAEVLPRLAGVSVKANTIAQWAKRGRLEGHVVGDRTLYLVGDVLDLHARSAA